MGKARQFAKETRLSGSCFIGHTFPCQNSASTQTAGLLTYALAKCRVSAPSRATAQWLDARTAKGGHSNGGCTGFSPVSLFRKHKRERRLVVFIDFLLFYRSPQEMSIKLQPKPPVFSYH